MRKFMTSITLGLFACLFITGIAFATERKHDTKTTDKVGDLIHESTVDGYTLAYYFMDLRNQTNTKNSKGTDNSAQSSKEMEMDKPHHLMVYIQDENKKTVLKGKVGFIVKNKNGINQKAMAMFMSNGFGATADMKKKGVYTILTKAILGDKKLSDSFQYEIN